MALSGTASTTGTLSGKAILYMILLAVQFGIQPILSRRYTSPHIIKSTVVFIQEIVKFIMAYTMLSLSGNTSNSLKGMYIYLYTFKHHVYEQILSQLLLFSVPQLKKVGQSQHG
jgi:hypothetical protein